MLKIRRLKVYHMGEQEARKLLPHIKETDVYSPETANDVETALLDWETKWKDILASDMSRTKFNQIMGYGPMDPRMMAWAKAQNDYLFVGKVPIWSLERSTPDESKKITELKSAADDRLRQGLLNLFSGNPQQYLQQSYDSLVLQVQYTDARDKVIGKTLQDAESRIRSFWPQIAKREPLRLTMVLGAVHTPEKYTEHTIEPYDLTGIPESYLTQAFFAVKSERHAEEVRSLLLRSGVQELLRGKIIRLEDSRLETLTERELEEVITNR